jgi:hypothetical protein
MSVDLFGLSLSSDLWYRRIVLDEVAQDMRQNYYGSPSHHTKHQKLGHSFLQYEAYAKLGTDTKKTEDFLKSRMEEGSHFMPCINLGEEEPFAWYGLRLNSEAKEAVEKYEGIELLLPRDGSNKHYNLKDPSDATNHNTLAHESLRYEAVAKPGTDTRKTEEFLKSQMEEGSRHMPCKNTGDEGPFAWYGFRLSPEARDAVEEYEGIEFLKVMYGSNKHSN